MKKSQVKVGVKLNVGKEIMDKVYNVDDGFEDFVDAEKILDELWDRDLTMKELQQSSKRLID